MSVNKLEDWKQTLPRYQGISKPQNLKQKSQICIAMVNTVA